jgi:3-hydroxypropanoate dehydrogenase
MTVPLAADSLDTLFRNARSHNGWQPQPVPDGTLHALYDLLKWGPTANNTCPARFVFVRTPEGKEKLRPALRPNNVDKAMSAPVVAIVAIDTRFYDQLPTLFPAYDARAQFVAQPALAETVGLRNGSLQGAYLMVAARALGLDCGPMGGFDAAVLDAAFFPDGGWKSNFLCALGHGDPARLRPRGPRLAFDQACRLA